MILEISALNDIGIEGIPELFRAFYFAGMCIKSLSGSVLWRNDGSLWTSAYGMYMIT